MSLTTEHQQQVEKIFAITRRMGELTTEKAWSEIAEIEAQRRVIFESLLENVSAEESPEISDAIQRVLQADNLIIEAGGEEKLQLMEELLKLGKGRKASKAYHEHKHV